MAWRRSAGGAIMATLTQHQALSQLEALGYKPGDRVYIRAIPPKKTPLETLEKMGMAWRPPGEDKAFAIPISGHLTLGESTATFTRLFKSGKTKLYPNGLKAVSAFNRKGYGIYLVVNPGGDEDEDISEARSIFYECDDIGKAEQWERAKKLETELGQELSLIIETRKSLHCYLRLGFLQEKQDLKHWQKLQQRLIQKQDSDPAIANPARLMRLAGFSHWKWDTETEKLIETPVTIRQQRDSSFLLGDLDEVLPAWDKKRWQPKKQGGAAIPTEAADNPFDIRNFAAHLEGYDPNGRRRGWITAKCPAHNGESLDSLHIEASTGAFKCHAGCDSKNVYHAALELAKTAGYQIPSGNFKRGAAAAADKQPELYGFTAETVERVNQRYLEELRLPVAGSILAISSAMGTGKTEALKHLKAELAAQDLDGIFDIIGYRNGLGRQTAQRIGSQHLRDLECDHAEASQLLIDDAKSLAYCVDSLHRRAAEIHRAIAQGRKVCLVLDEADAVTRHLLLGGTIRDRRAEVLNSFQAIIKAVVESGGYVIAMEADLPQIVIDFLREMAGDRTPVSYIQNGWQPHRWQVKAPVFLNKEGKPSGRNQRLGAIKEALDLLHNGASVFFGTDSQTLAEQLHEVALGQEISALRVDGNTSEEEWARELLEDPGKYFDQHGSPQLFIATSSCESGLSIPEGYFSHRVIYGSHLEDRVLLQMAGRSRGNSPLSIYAKYRAFSSDDNPDNFTGDGILKAWQNNARDSGLSTGAFQEFATEMRLHRDRLLSGVGEISHRYAASYQARFNISAANLRRSLLSKLKAAGHQVEQPEVAAAKLDPDKQVKRTIDGARDRINERHTDIYLKAPTDKSASWAKATLGKPGAKLEERIQASKILTLESYPGLPLSSDEDFVSEMIVKQKGLPLRQYTAKWLVENPEVAKEIDKLSWASQLTKEFIWLPNIKRESVKAKAFADCGLLDIVELDGYREDTPEVEAAASWAKSHAPLLNRLFRLQIKTDQTNIQICNKLLRKLGYKPSIKRKEGGRGEQVSVWTIDHKGDRYRKRVEASLTQRWEKLFSPEAEPKAKDEPFEKSTLEKSVGSICTNKKLLQIDPTPVNPPPVFPIGTRVKWGWQSSVWEVEGVEDGKARLKQVEGEAIGYIFSAGVSQLSVV